jgi:hypothetical protein
VWVVVQNPDNLKVILSRERVEKTGEITIAGYGTRLPAKKRRIVLRKKNVKLV